VRARSLVPLALTVAYALFTFWPQRGSVPGWGGDPIFNLWTFEHVWRQMDRLGPIHLWSDRFWSAPIFAGMPLQLAFSENQLYAALILRPLWRLFGGPVALQWGAILMTLAAFGCAFGWLRSLGLRDLAGAGALLFACCGFVQSQYAHYQNLCIFLLPLALWSWSAFERAPALRHAALCALAFGWIGGWNLYYQVFADLLLVALVLIRRSVPLRWRAAVVVLAALLQAPIALKYFELQRTMGSFSVALTYGATPRSLLGTAMRPTLLQRLVPFYPASDVPIESAGFLGLCWAALLLAAVFRPRARPWAIAALASFWAAMGLGHGLFDVLHLFPGFSALRAAGRFQVLTALFAVPAALLVVANARGALRWAPLAIATLELVPARGALRMPVALDFGQRATAFDAAATRGGPVLVVPSVDVYFQLYALPANISLLQGLSGRAPANVELVDSFFSDRPWTADSLTQVLELTRAPLVASTDPRWIGELSSSALLEREGCFEQFDRSVCLFRPRVLPDGPKLGLDRDAGWEYGESPQRWPLATLRAMRSGVVDYAQLGRCRLGETTKLGPLSWTRQLAFPGARLRAARFDAGDVVLSRESRQTVFRLLRWARPTRTYAVRCE
jgi:hypothetical protein